MAPKRNPLRTALTVGAILIALAALGWILGPSGEVHGVEFSPDRFSHRSFRYYQWCGIPITPRETCQWRSHVDKYVHDNGFAANADAPDPRWHFVKGFAPGLRGWHGDAKHMCQSLGCWGGDDRWVKWSEEHRDLALILWPQVVAWARKEQYDEIMALFRLTDLAAATTADDIHEKIERAKVYARD